MPEEFEDKCREYFAFYCVDDECSIQAYELQDILQSMIEVDYTIDEV